ncbi:hypothetical protein GLYMA_13G047200v4 [Glycine max]|uniref:Uncharacterized protein n=1 Tax=Glycine max TaxID=3847 RepID=A0A0R0GTB3_SOYBN|nr:hypothetical protein GYH30_035152 [Glycine max]KRH18261.1 hypothetical protein GLYMA_13G047200v4 [Glycine max]
MHSKPSQSFHSIFFPALTMPTLWEAVHSIAIVGEFWVFGAAIFSQLNLWYAFFPSCFSPLMIYHHALIWRKKAHFVFFFFAKFLSVIMYLPICSYRCMLYILRFMCSIGVRRALFAMVYLFIYFIGTVIEIDPYTFMHFLCGL